MRARGEKGTTMVEFALVTIPILMLVISIFQVSLALSAYESMAYAFREGLRYASTKGPNCSNPGNSCAVTLGAVAQRVSSFAVGINQAQLNVTFTSSAGSTSCTPLSTCTSSTAVWPPRSLVRGDYIAISGNYPYAITFVPFFANQAIISSGALSAKAQVNVLF